MSAYTDQEYIETNPFCSDESELSCRTVSIRTARKSHKCWTLNGKQDHDIQPGQRYRHERALIDGSFFGEYKICLDCMDSFLSGHY